MFSVLKSEPSGLFLGAVPLTKFWRILRGMRCVSVDGAEKSAQRGIVTAQSQVLYALWQSWQFRAREYWAEGVVLQGICWIDLLKFW